MAQMSPLRRRMNKDMALRNLSPAMQRSYLSWYRSSADILADRRTIWAWRTFARSKFIWWRRGSHGLPGTRSSVRGDARPQYDPGAHRLRAGATQTAALLQQMPGLRIKAHAISSTALSMPRHHEIGGWRAAASGRSPRSFAIWNSKPRERPDSGCQVSLTNT